MDNITKLLKELELNTKESKIYLSLLQIGPSSIQKISEATALPRSTVYQRVESLKKSGFINEEIGQKGRVIHPISPDDLLSLVKERAKESEKKVKIFENVLPKLNSFYQPSTTKAKVMHFEGVKGLQRMIYDHDMESKDKNLYGYATLDMNKVLGDKFMKKYHKKFYDKGYIDHFIMSDKEENQKFFKWEKQYKLYKENRVFVRKLPQTIFDPKVSVAIYDDKYSISHMKEGTPFGVIIQNQEMKNHQMEIFYILWKLAKPI